MDTIDLQETFGRSALIIAIEQNRNDMVSWLLGKGAAVNLVQNDGSSALMSASTNGNVKIFARKWYSDRRVFKRRPINRSVCSYTE